MPCTAGGAANAPLGPAAPILAWILTSSSASRPRPNLPRCAARRPRPPINRSNGGSKQLIVQGIVRFKNDLVTVQPSWRAAQRFTDLDLEGLADELNANLN